jgi:hypothetical protein
MPAGVGRLPRELNFPAATSARISCDLFPIPFFFGPSPTHNRTKMGFWVLYLSLAWACLACNIILLPFDGLMRVAESSLCM